MVDKNYCMSSFLAFRYIVDDDKDFYEHTKHLVYKPLPNEKRVLVNDEVDIDSALNNTFESIKDKKKGLLLSGGMDSACLASYMPGADAYTFRFLNGSYQRGELQRAELYAKEYGLCIHYVDIDWDMVQRNLHDVMYHKGAPVHSIEPQIFEAAKQAKEDGVEVMVIGDAADYVFGGMDGLHAKDWSFEEFIDRYIYIMPEEVLRDSVDIKEPFERYRLVNGIDYIGFMHEYADIESYGSYKNAFDAAGMDFIDPYEPLKMYEPLDLKRVRNGESKYLIRALFKMKYPNISVPEKLPMPRPVDEYFKKWDGPKRPEFNDHINMSKYSGNQKWLIYCLERFLEENEPSQNATL